MAEQALKKYYYRARDRKGLAVQGNILAIDQRSALQAISELNLIPIDVGNSQIQKSLGQIEAWRKSLFRSLPRKDLLIFTQQLHTIYAVGIPILRGLEIIRGQTLNKKLQQTIQKMIVDISEGQNLSSAIEKHPHIFDNLFVNLVKVGELSGTLEEILDRIYSIKEAQEENAVKVSGALFYPKLVMGFMTIVFIFVVNFIIPKLKEFLDKLGGKLPAITNFLLSLSDFFVKYAPIIFPLAALAYFAFKIYIKTEKGKMLWDRAMLKLPIIGSLLLMIEMNSFCVILELLIRSGVDILTGFKIISGTAQNALVSKDLETCRIEIEKGGTISNGLAQGKVIPPMVYNLVAVGEEAGSLEKALNRIAKFYKLQIDYKVNTLSKAIEPLLLFLIFGMVLVLALGVFMPIWSMSTSIKK